MKTVTLILFFITFSIVKALPSAEPHANPEPNADPEPEPEANPQIGDIFNLPQLNNVANIPIVGEIVKKASDHFVKLAGQMFQVFKIQFNKTYGSEDEENQRFQVFVENFKLILRHKSKILNRTFDFELGLTPFTDLTDEEFEQRFCKDLKRDELPSDVPEIQNYTSTVTAPEEVDWRQKGAVTPIKDQKTCGACWTYAAAGAIEAAHFRKTGELLEVSTQDLLDCTGKGSCMGGHYIFAYVYSMKNKGVNLFENYPYENQKRKCRHDDDKTKAGSISGYKKLKGANEEALKQIVAFEGPVAIGVDSRGWKLFKGSGVFYDDIFCPQSDSMPDHAVLLVGYGTKNGKDYWLIKNSWGEEWGDKGYIRIARNKDNHCHVASDPVYPIP